MLGSNGARNRVDFAADIAIDATEAQDITSDSNATCLRFPLLERIALVFVDCQLGLKEGKMKGSTKPERMDEPFSFKPEDRSHQSCVLHELGGNARRCQSS